EGGGSGSRLRRWDGLFEAPDGVLEAAGAVERAAIMPCLKAAFDRPWKLVGKGHHPRPVWACLRKQAPGLNEPGVVLFNLAQAIEHPRTEPAVFLLPAPGEE